MLAGRLRYHGGVCRSQTQRVRKVHSGSRTGKEPAMSRKESKSPTFDRIVEASLQLFNQQGERSVTTISRAI
jgi:hypothetical protein